MEYSHPVQLRLSGIVTLMVKSSSLAWLNPFTPGTCPGRRRGEGDDSVISLCDLFSLLGGSSTDS